MSQNWIPLRVRVPADASGSPAAKGGTSWIAMPVSNFDDESVSDLFCASMGGEQVVVQVYRSKR